MKLVILDRDGTLNAESDEFIKSPDEWQPLPGALEAVARLNHAGWHVVLATNQPGLGRGLFDMSTLNAIHAKMHKKLAALGARLDAVFFCPHSPEEGCRCAKPQPGLFEQIAERYGTDLRGMPTVGDRLRDLLAGVAVGCEPHLLLTGDGARYRGQGLPPTFPADTVVHEDLAAFATYLIEREARLNPPQPSRRSAA